MQMTLSLTPGLFLWQNGTRSDKPERSGPIASREDALQKEQQRFAACHGTSPEPQQCAGASGGLWELCCLHWQVFREVMGSQGLCPLKPTGVFICSLLCKPHFVPV